MLDKTNGLSNFCTVFCYVGINFSEMFSCLSTPLDQVHGEFYRLNNSYQTSEPGSTSTAQTTTGPNASQPSVPTECAYRDDIKC